MTTKTFDSVCERFLGENTPPVSPVPAGQQPPKPGQPSQPAQPGQPAQANQPKPATPPPAPNSNDYKKLWDEVSKAHPEHLQKLAADLASHLKTAAQTPAQPQNAANKQA